VEWKWGSDSTTKCIGNENFHLNTSIGLPRNRHRQVSTLTNSNFGGKIHSLFCLERIVWRYLLLRLRLSSYTIITYSSVPNNHKPALVRHARVGQIKWLWLGGWRLGQHTLARPMQVVVFRKSGVQKVDQTFN